MNKRLSTTFPTLILMKMSVLVACVGCLSACGGGSSQAKDPTVAELPIAYVERTTPVDTNGNPISGDITDPEAMQPGAHLIVKQSASVNAPAVDITQAIIGNTGDVRYPSFSSDGTKLLFSLHKAMVQNANPPITWDIYEYDLTKPLSQTPGSENPKLVMPFNNSDGDDIMPHFIPGDRIIFASDRATDVTGAIELNEGFFSIFKPTVEDPKSNKHSFHLFSMALDGTNLKQLTFNMSDDLYPAVIRNIPGLAGRVMFSRWEHNPNPVTGRPQLNQMTLYTMKPDGSDVQLLYGENSHDTGTNTTGTNNATIQFTQPQETSAGKVMALAMPIITNPSSGTYDGGDPVLLDVQNYTDINQPLNPASGLTGPGQISLSNHTASTVPGISLGGRFSSIFPLLDGTNRALVSYSLCYVTINGTNETKGCNDPSVDLSNATEAPPRYGIFLYNIGTQSMLPITPPKAGIYYTDVTAAENLTAAPYIPYNVGSGATGIIDIRSVYDMDGSFNPMGSTATSLSQLADPAQSTADLDTTTTGLIQRPAIFLRIVKGTYMPDKTTYNFKSSAFGVSKARLMRQIIGYAPIFPDGSVKVKVPANVPLSFSIVDKNGRRVRTFDSKNRPIDYRHGTWLSVRPGETMSCSGCHSPYSTAPHGRLGGPPDNFYSGATQAEVNAAAFTNTVIVPTQVGETMAEAATTASVSTLTPSVDINFNYKWTNLATASVTNPKRTQLDTPFFYDYQYLPDKIAPVASACMAPSGSWNVTCRISIDYKTDIDPMWSYARVVTDALGNPVMVNGATQNVTCTSCHSYGNVDANNNPIPPAGQLDLSDNVLSETNADWLPSYSQLLLQHNQVDATGAPVLDANGNNLTVPASLVHGSANSSSFFSVFAVNPDGTCPAATTSMPTPHCTSGQPWLTMHELKLLSEWVDIGAQYYNNPFAAPKN